jgi:hypothetical protein
VYVHVDPTTTSFGEGTMLKSIAPPNVAWMTIAKIKRQARLIPTTSFLLFTLSPPLFEGALHLRFLWWLKQ